MTPYPHQPVLAEKVLAILRAFGMVYLAAEERTGKTLSVILAVEQTTAQKVLVVTKKKALKGWQDTLKAYKHKKDYYVVNYHQAYKYRDKYDLIVLDEAHNYISSYPKAGKIWKELKPFCADTPIIYISATPHAQGYQMLYHQFALCDWSPWDKCKNFYQWFKLFGKPYTIEINGVPINQYDKVNDKLVKSCVEHLFVTATREELGFDYEPIDRLHTITLDEPTKAVYNTLLDDGIINLSVGELVCLTTSKLRTSLHQIEGGTIKLDDEYHVLANTEKIDYILEQFGDREDLVIMYNFKAELTKLQRYFKKALLLQATSYAEGVDLKDYSDLVIYSQDYSTARHTQRRARQCNYERKSPIVVHFLLVNKAISSQVYKTVSVNKKNYVDSVFKKENI